MRKAKRHLQQDKVWMAEEVQHRRIKKIQEVLSERVKKDANLAKEMLDAIGKVLPPELRKDAEESVAKAKANIDAEAAEKLESVKNALIDKWEKTGLLDGKMSTDEECKKAIIIESQEKVHILEPTVEQAGKDCLTPDPLNGNVVKN